MSKTSSISKNKWNDAHYDRIQLTVPKGRKETVKAYADQCRQSVNYFIGTLIRERIGMTEEEWKSE